MTTTSAFIPELILKKGNTLVHNLTAIASGTFLLCLLAQISILLPFTPVPITGQTFGVALIALLWGKSRGVACVASYLALGSMGLPVFAAASSGLTFGPTFGYLAGMFIASFVMGSLSDLGWTKTFAKTWLAAFIGSVITFSCGVFVLSFFIPSNSLLAAGVLPFVPGDIIKTFIVCLIVTSTSKMAKI